MPATIIKRVAYSYLITINIADAYTECALNFYQQERHLVSYKRQSRVSWQA